MNNYFFCGCKEPHIGDVGSSEKVTSLICWKCLTNKFGSKGDENIYTQVQWKYYTGEINHNPKNMRTAILEDIQPGVVLIDKKVGLTKSISLKYSDGIWSCIGPETFFESEVSNFFVDEEQLKRNSL